MKPLVPGDPTAIASYRLLGVLGGGGMGRVYLGQSLTGRRVAIKVIRGELAEDPVFRRRFAREVAAARSVNPLFTAAVVDADPDAASPWLATAYIDGPSLASRVRDDGPLPVPAVLTLAAGLAEALASIHQVGLVHRDLKPSNVLLDGTGPHIIDFGIARSSDSARLTLSLVVGTPSYMAPERLRGKEASPAGDVFALGATLVYAASGHNLIADGTMYAQAMQIIKGRFDLSAVPRPLRPFIVRCICTEPRDRPSALELARILVASGAAPPRPGWYGGTAPESAPAIPVPEIRFASHRLARRAILTLGGAVGLGAVGGGVSAASTMFTRTSPAGPSPTGGPALAQPPGPPDPPPATLLWQAMSPSRAPGTRIAADLHGLIITATRDEIRVTGMSGNPIWARSAPLDPATLRRWGDGVLIGGGGQLWLFDAQSGTQRFCVDTPVRVPVALPVGNRAYAQLGNALAALDRRGRAVWRKTGPLAAGEPLAVDGRRMLIHDVTGAHTRRVGLRDTATGALRWSTAYDLRDVTPAPPPADPQPGPPPAPPPDGLWDRAEAAFGEAGVLVRDGAQIRLLHATDGRQLWSYASPRPVAATGTAGDLVIVAADQLTARYAESGEPAWTAPIRGARFGVAGDIIVVADENAVTGLDLSGTARWRLPLPDAVLGGVPQSVDVDGSAVVVAFGPGRPGDRVPTADVIAVRVPVE